MVLANLAGEDKPSGAKDYPDQHPIEWLPGLAIYGISISNRADCLLCSSFRNDAPDHFARRYFNAHPKAALDALLSAHFPTL
jgi:hypothetical protein